MSRERPSKGKPRSPILEELERRLLLSADVPSLLVSPDLADPGFGDPPAQLEIIDSDPAAGQHLAEARPGRELLIVDPGVDDYEELVHDLRESNLTGLGLEVVLLDAGRDGITQIGEILAGYEDLGAIHIVSHGRDAAVQLGSGWLDADSLYTHASAIAGWGDALTEDGDILLYGCDLAASEQGKQLVESLASVTGADVAASDDETGHVALGGDWDLEYEAGDVEAEIAFGAEARQEWRGLLALVNLTAHEGQNKDWEIKSDQNAGQTFSYTSGSGSYTLENLEVQLRAESDASAQNLTVSLRASWGGADIASTTIASSSLSTTQTWQNLALGGEVLNDGQTYYIRITSDSTDGKVYAGYDDSSGYANGDFIDKDGNPQSGQDLAFRAIGIVPVITARETVDSDGDGEVDQVRITTDENLNDNFGDLNISVAGYAVTGYTTDIANDNIFYVDLTESGTPDTDATPNVTVVANTLLMDDAASNGLATDAGSAATDDADPVATITRDDANPTVATSVDFSVDFSEDVSNVTADDFTVVTTGTATANAIVTVTQVTPSTYTITVDTIAGNGSVGLDFNGATDIIDSAGNPVDTTAFTDEVYTVGTNTAPFFPPTAFITHTIDNAADGAKSVTSVDLDGDGDMDVVAASPTGGEITWYENDGSENFTEHLIAFVPFVHEVTVADVDGDGDLDVLSAGEQLDEIAWHENDGSENFTERVITTNADGARSVTVADVDGDGDLDVLSASMNDDTVAWYENDGGVNPTFTERVITTNADGAFSVFTGDVDGDGDLDVVSASRFDNKIAWYENDGGVNPTFTERFIATSAADPRSVTVGDVDGDGDLDVLSAAFGGDEIAWYENDGGVNPTFTAHTITTNADGAYAVRTADMDGDGDLDVLSASQNDNTVAWYENDGGINPTFTERVITTAAGGARDVATADVDGDGDLDVLSADASGDTVAWYENDGALNGAPTFTEGGPAVVLDTDVDVGDAELDTQNGGLGNYAGASVTLVRNGGANSDDVLSFNDGNGITLSGGNLIKNSQVIATFDATTTPGQLVITFTDANGEIPTSADVDNVLRQITYANSSNTPPATVQINWTFDDGNTGGQGAGGALQAVGSTTVNIIGTVGVTARETVDSDGDGEIDQIRITTDENLNDNFGDLNISVTGYSVTGYSTDIANDNVFYVDLTESGTPDTDATPDVSVDANTLLTADGGTAPVALDGSPVAATDGAGPVITARETVDSDGDGEIDQIRITTSENLDDDFSGLSMEVVGYTINTGMGTNGFTTGTGGDNVFFVNLNESGTPDTDATPHVAVTANTSLGDLSGSDIEVEGTAGWWDYNWLNRQEITLDNSATSTHTDFPVLIDTFP
jgi:hypothetical protein